MTTDSLLFVAAREVRSSTGSPGGDSNMRWLLSTVKPELWIDAINYWTAYLVACGIREHTIKLRRYQIGRLATDHLNRSPWLLSTQDLTVWLADQDWAPETRKSFRSALRSFYGWAAADGRVRRDPTVGLRSVRTFTPPPKPVPEDVLERALAGADDRTRLILLLASCAGLRRSEIAELRWDQIQMQDNPRQSGLPRTAGSIGSNISGALRVKGKGGRVRVIPLHPRLAAELQRYDRRGPWVFPGQSGPITAGHVGVIARRVLGGGWTAHTLRHRFATRAYAGTHDLLAVQALLGHADPATTKRYTQLADETLTAAVRSV